MKELGIGFIGAGLVANVHARAVGACPGAKLVGLWNRSPERAQEKARAYGCRRYATAADLVQDPEVDAVFVLTNLETHLEYTRLALESGKHVLVEKPVGVSVGEIEQMKELAAYEDGIVRARELLESGELGDPVAIYVLYNIEHPESVARLYPGVIRQILTHHSYVLLYLGGRPTELCAMKATLHYEEATVEDIAMVTLRLGSDALGHFCASFAADDHAGDPWTFMVKMIGTKGATRYSYRDWVVNTPADVHSQTYMAYEFGIRNEVRHFVSHLCSGGPPPLSSLDDAITAQRIVEACERSVDERRFVEL